jgi:mono/diheme cytochrome c family protein
MRWPAFLVVVFLTACGREETPPDAKTAVSPRPEGEPTFTQDIAPIVHTHCVTCHRPGESGPFDLLTYDDARKRARQIADVTTDGFMPPWLPEAGFGDLVGERRLTPEQIDLVRRWADGGAPEGDPAALPPLPRWTAGWQLGEPDTRAPVHAGPG